MGLFGFFTAKIPQFDGNDPVELQVQSLLHGFKRLRINKLASFPQNRELKYTNEADSKLNGDDAETDAALNVAGLRQLLLQDEHRVLIDWPKNKFRSLCILSQDPESKAASESKAGFGVSSFAFTALPVGVSYKSRDIAAELAHSLLYLEHHSYVSFAARHKLAMAAVAKHNSQGDFVLTESLKASIIEDYLKSLAFRVQLVRIYKAKEKEKEKEREIESDIREREREREQDRERARHGPEPRPKVGDPRPEIRRDGSMSPKKEVPRIRDSPRLRSAKSYSSLPRSSVSRPGSPLKSESSRSELSRELSRPELGANARVRPTVPTLNANEIYNPVAAPPSPSKESSISDEFWAEEWERCSAAISEKLRRERKAMGR